MSSFCRISMYLGPIDIPILLQKLCLS